MTIKASVLALFAIAAVSALPQAQAAEMLTTPQGMTLYTFDNDSGGMSACSGPCAQNWPPYVAAPGAMDHGDWMVTTRSDGVHQWAYKGKPLYLWSKDQKPGDTMGDGFKGIWHVARP